MEIHNLAKSWCHWMQPDYLSIFCSCYKEVRKRGKPRVDNTGTRWINGCFQPVVSAELPQSQRLPPELPKKNRLGGTLVIYCYFRHASGITMIFLLMEQIISVFVIILVWSGCNNSFSFLTISMAAHTWAWLCPHTPIGPLNGILTQLALLCFCPCYIEL